MRWRVGVAAVLAIALVAERAAAQSRRVAPAAFELDSLLRTRGPRWREARSEHFVVYAESGLAPRYALNAITDSLENGWADAQAFLGASISPVPMVAVLVVHSPSRLPAVLAPHARGLAFLRRPPEGEIVVLVHSDSARLYARHEVMHVVSRRAWGMAALRWASEGLAAWVDGRCQSTSVLGVARDLLRAEPGLTLDSFRDRFLGSVGRSLGARHESYALAASAIGWVLDAGGQGALRRFWAEGVFPEVATPLEGDATARWRAYVERAAKHDPGIPAAEMARRGCG